jgi:predicted RNase H-like nuclease
MATIYGLDATRRGWIAVRQDTESGEISWRRALHIGALLEEQPRPAVIAVDVPIGLPEDGARSCDVEARRAVGPRRNSVFPAPLRKVLLAANQGDFPNLRAQVDGKRLSPHIWSVVPRILEVDELLRQDPSLQQTVREVHPELSFAMMNGGTPMKHPKKSAEGRDERAAILTRYFGDVVQRALSDVRRLRCASDDLLDAFAALWTAGRILRGEAITLPENPPRDAYGLRMEINA